MSVRDNGKGMTEEKRKLIFMHTEQTKKRTRVGLRNIDRRLKQLYNQGLTIDSTPDQATTVCFRIPK
ncbi:sensor histidine kinase [Paenibacillus sp. FA6]|uniref:sensor histidine kinase n=1 Tax=Paenibacillus sp. FA6 TaxID=3413029 RepID=UPI003F6568FF